MKVVIDISENDYWLACNHPETLIGVYAQAIKNGTPLPKGHGRLGDLDRLYNVFERNVVGASAFKDLFDNAPTIIEREDKE